MKHVEAFKKFLDDHVNLNQSRLDALKGHVKAITNLLDNKLEGYRKYSQQGSYALKTIIKPVKDNDEFDADILVFIKDDSFNPHGLTNYVDYVDRVYKTLKQDKNYADKIERNTRCVTIDYARGFHLDIVPCLEYSPRYHHQKSQCYICNRTKKKYELTDGDGYREWLTEKNRVVGGNNLRKVTRLLKFLRDHKDNFSVKSILLTTMLGNAVDDRDKNSNDYFSDLPTALRTLSNRVNDFLRLRTYMPTISNPVLQSENFNRHWDQKKYTHFRKLFDIYNSKIDLAFEETDHDRSVRRWRELFGDHFAR